MSLVKQTHELPCEDEGHPQSYHLTVHSIIPDFAGVQTPWKVETNWIKGSKQFRKDVSKAKAKSEFLKAEAIQRTYLSSRIR